MKDTDSDEPRPTGRPVMGGTMGPSGPNVTPEMARADAERKIADARRRATQVGVMDIIMLATSPSTRVMVEDCDGERWEVDSAYSPDPETLILVLEQPAPTDGMPAPRSDGLTAGEGRVMDALVTAYKSMRSLDKDHPDEMASFARGIHDCQAVLALRALRRAHPDGWA